MNSKIYVNFIVVAWGTKYIKECFKYSISSLLSQNNLFALKLYNVSFTFCIKKSDLNYFKKNYRYKILEKYFKIKFIYIDNLLREKKRRILHYAFYEGINSEKNSKKTCFFNILTDDVFADGSIKHLSKYFKYKNFCFFDNPIHCDSRIINTKLNKFYRAGVLTISYNELKKITLKSLSEFTKKSVIKDGKINNLNPYYFIFNFKNYMIKKSFLSHPLLFRTQKKITKFDSFIDYCLYPQQVKKGKIFNNVSIDKFLNISPNATWKNQYSTTKNQFSLIEYSNFFSSWAQKFQYDLMRGHTVYFKNKHVKKISKIDLKYVNKISSEIRKNIKIKYNYKNHPHWGTNHNYHDPKSLKNLLKKILKFNS